MMKRLLDISISCLALIVLTPVFILVAWMVYRNYGFPVLFKQVRPGRGAKPFTMYKFRTMHNAQNQSGEMLPDSARLTEFGKRLRSSSMDELPELWNVLRGEMSLVGPRPLLMDYLPLYSRDQARRHNVRPGITGWAQVNGRNAISWQEKLDLDIWYVDNQSLLLDLRIILKTIKSVIIRTGITANGESTTTRFKGNIEEMK